MTEFPQLDSGLTIPVFSQGDDPISYFNKAMAFISVVAASRVTVQQVHGRQGQSYVGTGYKINTTSSRECRRAGKDPGIPNGQAAQTTIPNTAAFQPVDLDAYDSECDDASNAKAVLMANLSKYHSDFISKVPHSESYNNDLDNQSVYAMQDFEQTPVVDFLDNEIISDSNIISYS
ncbi:hypothetical protein Tco_0091542 [Tanacetum coccineum]